jgi:hypothetical protein
VRSKANEGSNNNYSKNVSQGMLEYIGTPGYNPELEHKKLVNLINFFVVCFIQEKFLMVSTKLNKVKVNRP